MRAAKKTDGQSKKWMGAPTGMVEEATAMQYLCLLYTSDAADE